MLIPHYFHNNLLLNLLLFSFFDRFIVTRSDFVILHETVNIVLNFLSLFLYREMEFKLVDKEIIITYNKNTKKHTIFYTKMRC